MATEPGRAPPRRRYVENIRINKSTIDLYKMQAKQPRSKFSEPFAVHAAQPTDRPTDRPAGCPTTCRTVTILGLVRAHALNTINKAPALHAYPQLEYWPTSKQHSDAAANQHSAERG